MTVAMRFYVGDMDPEDFAILLGHARQLSHRQRWRADEAAETLRAAGPLAVRPLACTIEEVLQDGAAPDEAVDAQAERAAAVVRSIGAPAAPALGSLVDERACNLCVREWAQDMLFEALGLEARRAACRHVTRMRLDGDRAWTCLSCGAGFGDGEVPTEGPGPAGRPRAAPRRAARG